MTLARRCSAAMEEQHQRFVDQHTALASAHSRAVQHEAEAAARHSFAMQQQLTEVGSLTSELYQLRAQRSAAAREAPTVRIFAVPSPHVILYRLLSPILCHLSSREATPSRLRRFGTFAWLIAKRAR